MEWYVFKLYHHTIVVCNEAWDADAYFTWIPTSYPSSFKKVFIWSSIQLKVSHFVGSITILIFYLKFWRYIYIYILKGSLLELMHGNLMKYYMTDRLVCRLNDFIHLFPFLSLWAFWFFRVIQVWPILESHFFSSCWANENVKLGHWKLLNLSC